MYIYIDYISYVSITLGVWNHATHLKTIQDHHAQDATKPPDPAWETQTSLNSPATSPGSKQPSISWASGLFRDTHYITGVTHYLFYLGLFSSLISEFGFHFRYIQLL